VTDAVLRADGLAFGVAFPETKRHYKLGRSERVRGSEIIVAWLP
jgi:hypothetical protein